jgi:hypothetical protein
VQADAIIQVLDRNVCRSRRSVDYDLATAGSEAERRHAQRAADGTEELGHVDRLSTLPTRKTSTKRWPNACIAT